jgi:hypothetical protein
MNEADQLANLLSYTIFHIGVYISLVAGLIGAGVLKDLDHPVLRFSVACFLIAGICGAAVGSNIPEYDKWSTYAAADLGFWGYGILKYSTWTTIEHLAFWAGILPLGFTFIFRGPAGFRRRAS